MPLMSLFRSLFPDPDETPTATTVMTPTGEEIVEPGWDDEPTVVREVDPLLLEIVQRRPRATVRSMRRVSGVPNAPPQIRKRAKSA